MSAIVNVGELAAPYFLLEVWARRYEIDIDPETYATLKRKCRKLVRDALGFELRGQEPDDDWYALRREILALHDLEARDVALSDGRVAEVAVWATPDRYDAIVVGDLTGLGDPDVRGDDEVDPPATRFELALDAYEGDADWGLLLAGREVRVYRRSTGVSQQYLALQLDSLVELDDETQWKAFAGIFRAPAFAPDTDGVPLIRRVVDESRRHAAALADDMRQDVVHAAEAIIQGALDHPDNRGVLGEPVNRDTLQALFEETLYYLYRILFVLYAESRDVLPLSDGGAYATTYSIDHLVELAREEPETDGTYYTQAVHQLFDLLWHGHETAKRLGIDAVGGELFDPARTPLLDRCTVGDRYWRAALESVALGAPDSDRRKLGRRSSFAELGVDQLGSIYEGLLVLEPFLAEAEHALVRIDGDRRVVPPDLAEQYRLIRALPPGSFALESASGRRKGSGSFYTPGEITEYLTHAALDPLVEDILSSDDPTEAARRILDLRVCDPAMGSGAFLVQAARVLAVGLARARAQRGEDQVTAAMIHRAKREVVRRCLYGVDLNPLAVALAKVSLWLETLEPGKPLSFLDAHLRCGDALVGVDFDVEAGELRTDTLAQWPRDAVKGLKTYLKKEAGLEGEAVTERLKERKGPTKGKQARLPGIELAAVHKALKSIADERAKLVELEDGETLQLNLDAAAAFEDLEHDESSLRNRLRHAADFWCAQWFWRGEDALADDRGPVVPPGLGDFESIIGALLGGGDLGPKHRLLVEEADHVAEERRFFHWTLEFPEVMVDNDGFDAIIGNPPWNTLSPDVKEFFSTYDPMTFKRGVQKRVQDVRKAQLRDDPEIDDAWRRQARFLYQLSYYAKPEADRFAWYAEDGQLRKGDSNVFRLFVERAYELLRDGGRMAQVLPDSFYVSSPATGLRRRLLTEGRLERCYVFENRKGIFPIDSRLKIALVTAVHGDGPAERFNAAFYVGKDAVGDDRAIGLDELPSVLADLDDDSPSLTLKQVQALAPETWSFPELQTALDAEIVAQVAAALPALNLDADGWGLTYCRELDADKDAWRFHTTEMLEELGAERVSTLRWHGPGDTEWWPLVEGRLFYLLEFPMAGKEPHYWVKGDEVASISGRLNNDGTSVMHHYRVAWRDIARSVDERSAIAVVLPPRTAAKHKAPTVWGGSQPAAEVIMLAALMSSFPFDYFLRFKGATSLTYGILDASPAPERDELRALVDSAAEVVCRTEEFDQLWGELRPGEARPDLDDWEIGERRAKLDAEITLAYGLSLEQYAAVLSTFPNLDRVQPMLPGERKSFITRDLALMAYCELTDTDPPEITKLLRSIGVRVAEPHPDYRRLDVRVEKARELGAVPYRPTPKGGRPPEDPTLVADIQDALTDEGQTAADVAEFVDVEDVRVVKTILDGLVKHGEVYREGRGKNARYYVVED